MKKSDAHQNASLKEILYLNYFQIFTFAWFGFNLPNNLIDIINEFLEISYEDIRDIKLKLFYFCIKIRIHDLKSEQEQIIQLKTEVFDSIIAPLNSSISHDDTELLMFIGLFYAVISLNYVQLGENPNDLLEMVENCHKYWIQLNKPFYDFLSKILKLEYYFSRENFDKHKYWANQTLNYFIKHNYPKICLIVSLIHLCAISHYSPNHDLKEAIEYNEKSLKLINELDSEKEFEAALALKIIVKNQQGMIYDLLGDFDSSILTFHEALNYSKLFYEKFGLYILISSLTGNLGENYTEIGNFELGLQYQLEALKMRKNAIKNPLYAYTGLSSRIIAESYYQLIRLYLLLQKKDEAMIYFEDFKKEMISISSNLTKFDSDQIMAKFKISESLLLINNNSFKDIGKAQELLNEVIKMPLKFELTIDGLIPLIEIVVQQYKLFQNQESLDEFQELSNLITNLLERSNAGKLKINLLLLQGKIAFIQGDIISAKSFYNKSLKLAEAFHLLELTDKIKSE